MTTAVKPLAAISRAIPRRFLDVSPPQLAKVNPPKSKMQKVPSQTAMTATVRPVSPDIYPPPSASSVVAGSPDPAMGATEGLLHSPEETLGRRDGTVRRPCHNGGDRAITGDLKQVRWGLARPVAPARSGLAEAAPA